MGARAVFAFDFPTWLPPDVVVPAAVGAGVGFVIVLTFHLLRRPKAAPHRPLAEPEFDPFLQGSASEQRERHRRGGNPVEVKVRPAGDDRHVITGWVLDRSAGGLALRTDRQFTVGAVLHVRPANASPITPSVEVEVKSAQPTPDGWRLGCQFVKAPTWALLMSFG